jgi:hypothetical protein
LAFTLQTGQNHGLLNFTPLRSHRPNASAKSSYAPPALKATIVLPAFARSFPADGYVFGRANGYGLYLVGLVAFLCFTPTKIQSNG